MSPTTSFSLIFLSFLLFSSATAFNITKILGQNPDFSNFNDLLTQSQVASLINSRETITVLAVDNSAIGAISGKSKDVVKDILTLHVVLDYYDPQKLQKLSNKTTLLTTLFQTSGKANSEIGFVNVTVTSNGVAFGSAVKGAPIDSKLVKSVAAQPYNISVLQISSPIIPQGIDSASANHSTSPPPSGSPAGAPKKAPTPSPSKAPSPKSAKAPTPSAATPSEAPISADAPGGAADAPGGAADAPSPKPSSGSRASVGMFVSVVTLGVASWFAL